MAFRAPGGQCFLLLRKRVQFLPELLGRVQARGGHGAKGGVVLGEREGSSAGFKAIHDSP